MLLLVRPSFTFICLSFIPLTIFALTGQTCGDYAASYMSSAPGYIDNPNAMTDCYYCPSSSGLDYIHNLGYKDSQKWRDWGIFIVWCVSMVGSSFALTW